MGKLRTSRFPGCIALITTLILITCPPLPGQSCDSSLQNYQPRYRVVAPGTHPGLLFCKEEIPGLKTRAAGGGLAAEAWKKVVELAHAEAEGRGRAGKLTAMALVYQIEGDRALGRQAVEQFKEIVAGIDPVAYHREIGEDFFATDLWPIPFAYAWDWLYELLEPDEKAMLLAGIENWCKALFEHTESRWWQEASYNCGAIPVGALGLACTAIRGESHHPEFDKWFESAVRRIRLNYFPGVWRSSGICAEGPCYAIVGYENPAQFGEALRRTGGPDILKESGAINAMHYQTYQWLPQGGCGPIGDNTNYGRRVFAAEYLLGLGDLADRAGLWTFEHYTDRGRLDPVITFLWYPEGLEPLSPGAAGLPTSFYFEIARNRAGYVYSRSRWDAEHAAWFAFVTRYENANHQHYDMNSFLFSAFGEQFATHENIFPYSHEHHGADIEHNLVVVDQGGLPAHDRSNSAGDDCSLGGLLTGLGLGRFADYTRGDARWSYQDRSDPETLPALRADRSCLFVKQGPNPYLIVADDIQKGGLEHDYHWQWYTPARSVSGTGSLADPLLIEGQSAACGLAFVEPKEPVAEFKLVAAEDSRRPRELGLVRVSLQGTRVRYLAVAAAWEKGAAAPKFLPGPPVKGNPSALSLVLRGDGFTDLVLWQPEEEPIGKGVEVSCGELVTDGLLALVRTDSTGAVTGYVLGDGSRLIYESRVLAEAAEPWSVSADSAGVFATGRRRAREDLPQCAAKGRVWLPQARAPVFADCMAVEPFMAPGRMAILGR